MPRSHRHTSIFSFPPQNEVFSSQYPRPTNPTSSLSGNPSHISPHQLTPPCRFLNEKPTEIIVGLEKASLYVHKNILVAESPYFRAALTSGFAERDTNNIELPNYDPKIVELFVQWCYHQPALYSVFVEQKLVQLIQLYHFADSCVIPRLKNDIIWELFNIRRGEHILPKTCVGYAFNYLPEGCPLLSLLAAWYAWHRPSAEQLSRMDLESLPALSVELNFQHYARSHEQKPDPFSNNPNLFFESSALVPANNVHVNEPTDTPAPEPSCEEDGPPAESHTPTLLPEE